MFLMLLSFTTVSTLAMSLERGKKKKDITNKREAAIKSLGRESFTVIVVLSGLNLD